MLLQPLDIERGDRRPARNLVVGVLLGALVAMLGAPHSAGADTTPTTASATPEAGAAAAGAPLGDDATAAPVVSPPRTRGSGMWTSNVPSEDRPYRWRLLAVGVFVLALTIAGCAWLIRRAKRETNPPEV